MIFFEDSDRIFENENALLNKQGVFIFPNAMPQGGGYAIAIFKKN
jgi:hypothetical protein